MIVIISLVFIFFGCISNAAVFSTTSCPDAKYKVGNGLDYVYIFCEEASEDPCLIKKENETMLNVLFPFTAQEDVTDIYYNVSISGDKIDARASGKGGKGNMYVDLDPANSFPKYSKAGFYIYAYLVGDLPVGEEGIARVEVYFNENTKDTPDMCVETNIKIIEGEEDD